MTGRNGGHDCAEALRHLVYKHGAPSGVGHGHSAAQWKSFLLDFPQPSPHGGDVIKTEMFNRLKQIFGTKPTEPSPDAAAKLAKEWYDRKSKLMEAILGHEHGTVMHAIIPYAVGGALDLYYYPHSVPGTAIATKELSELPGQGSSNELFACYEIAMFTRHKLNLDQAKDDSTPFGRAHSNINSILNCIAPYSATATLNSHDTCEFPAEMKHVGGKCLIFDAYGVRDYERVHDFGVLAIIEIHRSEMDFARSTGGAELIQRLKAVGHYPYSDLDRDPVA